MARCSFCRKLIELGTGIMFVKNDGRIFLFCSGKCEKHLLKLDHKPRTTRWTLEFAREKKQAKPGAKEATTEENTAMPAQTAGKSSQPEVAKK